MKQRNYIGHNASVDAFNNLHRAGNEIGLLPYKSLLVVKDLSLPPLIPRNFIFPFFCFSLFPLGLIYAVVVYFTLQFIHNIFILRHS